MLLENLAVAEQRYGSGELMATRLRQDLARLQSAGDSTMETRRALDLCEQSQALRWAERAQLVALVAGSHGAIRFPANQNIKRNPI